MGLEKFRRQWQARKEVLEKAVADDPSDENKLALQNFHDAQKPNVDCLVASINKFAREQAGITTDSNLFLNPRFATKDE